MCCYVAIAGSIFGITYGIWSTGSTGRNDPWAQSAQVCSSGCGSKMRVKVNLWVIKTDNSGKCSKYAIKWLFKADYHKF